MIHSFDIEIATKHGVNCAILLQNIYFWTEKNKANEQNFYDGSYWTYNSTKAFAKLFPYMSEKQISYALNKLEQEGIIKTGNYNEDRRNKTKWYALTKQGYCILQNGIMQTDNLSNHYIYNIYDEQKTDNKQTDIKEIYKEKAESSLSYAHEEKKKKAFVPPTLEEVQAYINEKGYSQLVDAKYFLDYNEARNWKRGSVKMSNWKSAIVTWVHNSEKRNNSNVNFMPLDSGYDEKGNPIWFAHNDISADEFVYRLENNAHVFVRGVELTGAFKAILEEYPKKNGKEQAAKAFFNFVKLDPKPKIKQLVIALDTYISKEREKGTDVDYYVNIKTFIEERQFNEYPKYNCDVFLNGKYYQTREDYTNAIITGELEMHILPKYMITF